MLRQFSCFDSREVIGIETDTKYSRRQSLIANIATVGLTSASVAVNMGILFDQIDIHGAPERPIESGVLPIEVLNVIDSSGFVQYSQHTIEEEIAKAGDQLAFSTDGELTIDQDYTIRTISVDPDSSQIVHNTGFVESCYSEDQFNDIEDDYRDTHNVSRQISLMSIAQSAPACGGNAAYAEFAGNNSVYNRFTEFEVSHELGHNLGLGHVLALDCTIPGIRSIYGQRYELPYTLASIDQQLNEGCGIQRFHNGEINEYSSLETVMGRNEGPEAAAHGQTLLATELAIIAPERFHINPVASESSIHYLGMNVDKPIGISVDLPENHPLRTIDPTMDSISFSLMMENTWKEVDSIADEDNETRIVIVASARDKSYVIDTLHEMQPWTLYPSYYREQMQYEKRLAHEDIRSFTIAKDPIVYMDNQLDLVVSIGVTILGDRYVRFESFEESKKRIDYHQKITDEVSNRLFVD